MRISDWSSDVCSSDLLQNLHFEIAQVDRHFAVESDGGPGQAGRNRLYVAEKPGEAGDFARLVLFAALDDQIVGVAAGDDFLGVVGRSEEHTSELQSLMRKSYAVFCLKKKNKTKHQK